MGFQRMNKKGLEFKSMFFSLVILSMVIISVSLWVNAWGIKYDSGVTSDLGEYDNLERSSDIAVSQQTRISPRSPDPGTDFESTTFRGVFGVVNNIFDSLRTFSTMIGNTAYRFGVPDFVPQGVITMVLFAVIFAIVAIVFRIR